MSTELLQEPDVAAAAGLGDAPDAQAPEAGDFEADFGADVLDFGLGHDGEAQSAAPPLPTDGAAREERPAGSQEAAPADDPFDVPGEGEGEAGGEPAEKKADAPADDPDLSPEENEKVRQAPHGEREAVRSKLKAARFEQHFENREKPIAEVISYLETRSPERLSEMEAALIDRRTERPDEFAAGLYARDPERFGRTAKALFEGHPEFYAQALAGDESATPEALKEAWGAFKAGAGAEAATGPAAGEAPDAPAALSEEEREELRRWLPEMADKVEAVLRESARKPEPEPAPDPAQAEAERVAKETEAREIDEALDAGYQDLLTHLNGRLDDPVELGLAVTDAERKAAPALARAKSDKRRAVIEGEPGRLPGFEQGLQEWGQANPSFKAALADWGRAAQSRDRAASVAAAQKLRPFVEQYLDVRLKDPLFAEYDEVIRLAAGAARSRPRPEEHTPGKESAGSQTVPNDPESGFLEEVLNFGL